MSQQGRLLWHRQMPSQSPRSLHMITDTGSYRFPASPIRRVINSLYHQYGESTILHITYAESFILKDSVAMQLPISGTPRIIDTESWRLPISLIRWVGDSQYRWKRGIDFQLSNISVNSQPNCKGSNSCVGAPVLNRFIKKFEKSVSLPCPIQYAKICPEMEIF